MSAVKLILLVCIQACNLNCKGIVTVCTLQRCAMHLEVLIPSATFHMTDNMATMSAHCRVIQDVCELATSIPCHGILHAEMNTVLLKP